MISPSYFSGTHTNGLWEYSSYLYSMSLIEALELSSTLGIYILNRILEPLYFFLIYHTLIDKGYIQQGSSMQSFLTKQFIKTTKGNHTDYEATIASLIAKNRAHGSFHCWHTIQTTLNQTPSLFFNFKPLLRVYCKANWIPNCILDVDLPVLSELASMCITETKKFTDQATGKMTFKSTPSVMHTKADGISDEDLIHLDSLVLRME
ncbi:hypothetical protein FQN51_002449 [Onygenales sp. PD_10]|nr:hypothetical protein FQN51_002449 [Onygenales sp. PD_10]